MGNFSCYLFYACIEIKKKHYWICYSGSSNELVPQIKLHQNNCQYLLINYLVWEGPFFWFWGGLFLFLLYCNAKDRLDKLAEASPIQIHKFDSGKSRMCTKTWAWPETSAVKKFQKKFNYFNLPNKRAGPNNL